MKDQGWRAIGTQCRKASDILTSTLAAFFSAATQQWKGIEGAQMNRVRHQIADARTSGMADPRNGGRTSGMAAPRNGGRISGMADPRNGGPPEWRAVPVDMPCERNTHITYTMTAA